MGMKIERNLTAPLVRAGEDALRAETDGFDAVWSGEAANDPFLPLALAATSAPSIELGTGITVAFARSPMTVAAAAWDLQRLSGGRFTLGLGSQVRAHIERRYSMPWSKPADRMREYVQAVLAIWEAWETGGPLAFRGEFYRHDLAPPFFRPRPLKRPRPKIFVAAVGPLMTSVASEVADGAILHAFTTAEYMRDRSLPHLEASLAASGRSRAEWQIVQPAMVATGTTEEEMQAAMAGVRSQIAFYGSTPAYRPVLDLHGWGDLQVELHDLVSQGRWSDLSRCIDDETLAAFAVVGQPDTIVDQVEDRFDGLVDRVILHTPYRVSDDLAAAISKQLLERKRPT